MILFQRKWNKHFCYWFSLFSIVLFLFFGNYYWRGNKMLYSMFWTYHFFPLAAVVTSYVLSSLIKNLRAANLFSFRCHDYNGITVPVYVGLYIYIYIYSKTCQVDHLHKVTTCWCWPHIGRTGKVLCSLHIRPPP